MRSVGACFHCAGINTEKEYEDGLKTIMQTLRNSGAEENYITVGNNDLPDLIRSYMPFAMYIAPNSTIDIAGIRHDFLWFSLYSTWRGARNVRPANLVLL